MGEMIYSEEERGGHWISIIQKVSQECAVGFPKIYCTDSDREDHIRSSPVCVNIQSLIWVTSSEAWPAVLNPSLSPAVIVSLFEFCT